MSKPVKVGTIVNARLAANNEDAPWGFKGSDYGIITFVYGDRRNGLHQYHVAPFCTTLEGAASQPSIVLYRDEFTVRRNR